MDKLFQGVHDVLAVLWGQAVGAQPDIILAKDGLCDFPDIEFIQAG